MGRRKQTETAGISRLFYSHQGYSFPQRLVPRFARIFEKIMQLHCVIVPES